MTFPNKSHARLAPAPPVRTSSLPPDPAPEGTSSSSLHVEKVANILEVIQTTEVASKSETKDEEASTSGLVQKAMSKGANIQYLSFPKNVSLEEGALVKLCDILRSSKEAISEQGIFRISPDTTKLKEAKYNLKTFIKQKNEELLENEVSLLCAMIKHLFKSCYNSDRETIESVLKRLLESENVEFSEFPLWFLSTLDLCCDITVKSEINLMNESALSIIFSVNMLSGLCDTSVYITDLAHYKTWFESLIKTRNQAKENAKEEDFIVLVNKEKLQMPTAYASTKKEQSLKEQKEQRLQALCFLMRKSENKLNNNLTFSLDSKRDDIIDAQEYIIKDNEKATEILTEKPQLIFGIIKSMFKECYEEDRELIEGVLKEQMDYLDAQWNEEESKFIGQLNFPDVSLESLPHWFQYVLCLIREILIHSDKNKMKCNDLAYAFAPKMLKKPPAHKNGKQKKARKEQKEQKELRKEFEVYKRLLECILIDKPKAQGKEENKFDQAEGGVQAKETKRQDIKFN